MVLYLEYKAAIAATYDNPIMHGKSDSLNFNKACIALVWKADLALSL